MNKRIPVQQRSLATRQAIIRTADRIIAADGYHQMTMRGIARSAGLGVASIYSYFDSKEEILFAALAARGERARRQIEPLVAGWLRDQPEVGLRHFFAWLLHEGNEHARFVRAVWTAAPNVLEDPQAVRLREVLTTVLTLLLRSQPNMAERIDDGDVFLLSNSLVGILLGIGNGIPVTTTLDELVDKMVAACRLIVLERA